MTTPRKDHLDAVAVALLLACCLFWGFQQVLVKATVAEVAPVFQAFVRFALATLVLLLWCRWRGIAIWQQDRVRGPGLLAGALFAGEFACIYLGLQYTTASRLTVFVYCAPFWVAVLLPRFVAGENLRRAQWAGMGCAFVGVALALGDGLWGDAHATRPLGWLENLVSRRRTRRLPAGMLWPPARRRVMMTKGAALSLARN